MKSDFGGCQGDRFCIGKYSPEDRQSVRKIRCDTADLGEPVESFFRDRKLFADLLTSYYTDYEPQSCRVAEAKGKIAGYLIGCLSAPGFIRIMSARVLPRVLCESFFRGSFFCRQSRRMILPAIESVCRGGFRRKIPFNSYPAHLQIDIQPDFRGCRIGRRLMEAFCAACRAKATAGIHLSTRDDNRAAQSFF